jgi:hypothetical protein
MANSPHRWVNEAMDRLLASPYRVVLEELGRPIELGQEKNRLTPASTWSTDKSK